MQSNSSHPKRKLVAKTTLALVPEEPTLAVSPRFISRANSEAVTGLDFRRWCDHFPALVRMVGRKRVIVADELQRAVQEGIRKSLATPEAEVALDAAEKVRELLRNCASVRRAGGQ